MFQIKLYKLFLIMGNKISVIGLGYIGLPFALLLSKKGFSVDAIDINELKIKSLINASYRSEEEDINLIFNQVKNKKNLNFSTKLNNSDFYILCLPTPIKKNKMCDLSYLNKAIKQISTVIKKKNTIIIESTVPIGTTKKLFILINKLRPDLNGQLNICFSPEKAIPGNTLTEMKSNQRIIGASKKTFKLVKKIYEKFTTKKVKNYTIEEAEASKLLENSFRDNQIAFSNYIGIEFKKRNLNTNKIIEICNMHPRVNLLSPSIGVGGHCIPLDPYFLNFEKTRDNMILLSRKMNNKKTIIIISKLRKIIKLNKNKKICFWGIGYKPGSSDIRESPAIKIINALNKKDKFYISDPLFEIMTNKTLKISNFINPDKALKRFNLHIILNLKQKYVKEKFKNRNFILAENL